MHEAQQVPDDTELLEQIGRGDQAAFRALLSRHAQYLFGVAHSLTGNNADAEDIVQETLMAAITATSASRFRGESSVRTWLVRILVNRAAMLRRSAKRKSGTVALDEKQLNAASPPISAGAASIDARTDLTTMLQQLTPEHREVIVLRELQGMSYEQMALALQVPRGTIESRLHRAREELRKRFKGY